MQITILFFGQLTEITGVATVQLEHIADTDALVIQLRQKFPALASSKYAIAVDKKVINCNTILTQNCSVALLPPFSGG
jgi:molybdopterin converting factor small subunit